ncbi:MAG: phage tail tube protein [Rhodobacter sp.]|nr:phage tail tube protein [Rhodobacter sp.]
MLIKIGDAASPEVFTKIASMNAKQIGINGQEIDMTDHDGIDANSAHWAEGVGGVRRLTLSGDFRASDDATQKRLAAIMLTEDMTSNAEVVVPGIGQFDANFVFSGLEWSADDGMTGSVSAASTGTVTFTAE